MKTYLHEVPNESHPKANYILRVAVPVLPPLQPSWVEVSAHSELEAERIRLGIDLAAGLFGQKYHVELFKSEAVCHQHFTARETVETLISWLEDNVEMQTEIIFDGESADSHAMLPGLLEVLQIL